MNQLRHAYLLHDPELSRPTAGELLGVCRFTVQRWENFLTGVEPANKPSAKRIAAMEALLQLPAHVWQEAEALWPGRFAVAND